MTENTGGKSGSESAERSGCRAVTPSPVRLDHNPELLWSKIWRDTKTDLARCLPRLWRARVPISSSSRGGRFGVELGPHQRLPSIFEILRTRTEDLRELLTRGTLCLAPHESIAPSTNSGGGLVGAQWPPTYPIPVRHCVIFVHDVAPLLPPPGRLTWPPAPAAPPGIPAAA